MDDTADTPASGFLNRFGRWLFVPPLVVGVGVAALIAWFGNEPRLEVDGEARRPLRVIRVPVVEVVPRVTGYGTAQPGRTWRAVARVGGRIIEVHPELEAGSIVKNGEVLVRIDPADYQIAVTQREAEVEQTAADIEELSRQEENYRASIEIERESLDIAKDELARLEDLARQEATSRAEIDSHKKAVLSQAQRLQEQTNQLHLLPTRRRFQGAGLELKKAQLAEANLNLERTVIRIPFDGRLGDVALEPDQYVAAGETLFEVSSIELMEVEAQVLPRDVRRIVRFADPSVPRDVSMERMREIFDVDAVVQLAVDDPSVSWPAKFMRLREGLDRQTRTLRVVVGVEKPYDRAIRGARVPLLEGTFCRVTLIAKTREKRVIVPRGSVHGGDVHVLDQENRLRRCPVRVEFLQGDFAVIGEGLSGGEVLVVADPTPAIEGMLVEPVDDPATLERLIAEAGEETVQND